MEKEHLGSIIYIHKSESKIFDNVFSLDKLKYESSSSQKNIIWKICTAELHLSQKLANTDSHLSRVLIIYS